MHFVRGLIKCDENTEWKVTKILSFRFSFTYTYYKQIRYMHHLQEEPEVFL